MTEENATGETVKSDDSISKNWVEFYSNKKEGANTFKIDQRIINNIRTWIKPDTKFTQPFAGVFQGTTRNQMDTIVVMNIKKGKKVSKPLEIKTTDNLPLSVEEFQLITTMETSEYPLKPSISTTQILESLAT